MTTSLQTPVPKTDWYQLAQLRERNDFSYRSTVDYQDLPQPGDRVAHEAQADRVLVTATDIDVLAAWWHVMGGTVTTVDLPHGQTVWTLRTETWSDSPKFPVVPVFVSVVLATGASVQCEIRDAAVKS
ncbi:hypothetical protein ACH4UY_04655 [Streptomyces longwoodensis]|uniref:hypothetical protein n=1 Tax=Streptomyces longwoodensis TaxID=68231 RepID=UPI00378D83DE